MELMNVLGLVGFGLSVANSAGQVYAYYDKKKYYQLAEAREAQFRLLRKHESIFRDHVHLPTWKAKAYEAQDQGLKTHEVLELLEKVWTPIHRDPPTTKRDILDPIRVDLVARERTKIER